MNAYRCGWRCGDNTPGHDHYTVIVRENGRLLGRLTPDGCTTTRKIRAAIMARTTADRIAAEINDQADELTAVARKF